MNVVLRRPLFGRVDKAAMMPTQRVMVLVIHRPSTIKFCVRLSYPHIDEVIGSSVRVLVTM